MNATTRIRTIYFDAEVFDEDNQLIDQYTTGEDTRTEEGDYDAWCRFVGEETASALIRAYDTRPLSIRVTVKFLHWYFKDEILAVKDLPGEEYSRRLTQLIHEYPEDWTPYQEDQSEEKYL